MLIVLRDIRNESLSAERVRGVDSKLLNFECMDDQDNKAIPKYLLWGSIWFTKYS